MNEGTHLGVRVQSAFGCSAEKSPTKRRVKFNLGPVTVKSTRNLLRENIRFGKEKEKFFPGNILENIRFEDGGD